MPPRLLKTCSALLPGGVASPAVWQSQSRGHCLNNATPQRSFVARNSLPSRLRARQSQFCGPCLNGRETLV